MVTAVPTGPPSGVIDVKVGTIAKSLAGETAPNAVITVTGPVFARAGTVAVTDVPSRETTEGAVNAPPNVTPVAEFR
jgi:hypothetical protein